LTESKTGKIDGNLSQDTIILDEARHTSTLKLCDLELEKLAKNCVNLLRCENFSNAEL
jgi:hypothetical protein